MAVVEDRGELEFAAELGDDRTEQFDGQADLAGLDLRNGRLGLSDQRCEFGLGEAEGLAKFAELVLRLFA